MLSSFLQFAINSIILSIIFHYAIKMFHYFKNGKHKLAKAKIKRQLKGYIDKL